VRAEAADDRGTPQAVAYQSLTAIQLHCKSSQMLQSIELQ
jgi:hypothetical protein